MVKPKFRIFQIRPYQTFWEQADAVVSGKSPEDACLVLEDHLKNAGADYGCVVYELGFKAGEVIDTGILADKRSVLYSKNKRTFP